MNGPIPAGGEAMATRMNRRGFLVGAAVAVAAPAMAMAAANDQSEIFGLIRSVGKARELANAADEIEYAIFSRGDRPEFPVVEMREIPFIFRSLYTRQLNTSKQIDEVFQQYADGRRRHFDFLAEVCEGAVLTPQHEASLARQLQEGEDQRQRTQRLYSERAATYEAWELGSGHLAAQKVTEERWGVVWALEQRILTFPCTALEEVAAKARYIIAEYGSDYAREKQHAFIAEIAGMTEVAEVM